MDRRPAQVPGGCPGRSLQATLVPGTATQAKCATYLPRTIYVAPSSTSALWNGQRLLPAHDRPEDGPADDSHDEHRQHR